MYCQLYTYVYQYQCVWERASCTHAIEGAHHSQSCSIALHCPIKKYIDIYCPLETYRSYLFRLTWIPLNQCQNTQQVTNSFIKQDHQKKLPKQNQSTIRFQMYFCVSSKQSTHTHIHPSVWIVHFDADISSVISSSCFWKWKNLIDWNAVIILLKWYIRLSVLAFVTSNTLSWSVSVAGSQHSRFEFHMKSFCCCWVNKHKISSMRMNWFFRSQRVELFVQINVHFMEIRDVFFAFTFFSQIRNITYHSDSLKEKKKKKKRKQKQMFLCLPDWRHQSRPHFSRNTAHGNTVVPFFFLLGFPRASATAIAKRNCFIQLIWDERCVTN